MTAEKFPYYDESDFAGRVPIAGDPSKMREVIGKVLAERTEQSTRKQITEIIQSNENEMFVGDLLDAVALSKGYESVAPTWYSLEKMQTEGLVMMYISDGNRYTVCLTRSCK